MSRPALRTSSDALFAFDDPAAYPKWFPVNDDVMGGVSRSSYAISDGGTALFRGVLSFENNGGFATIRSPDVERDLSAWAGVMLRVRGDGRTYSFSALPRDRRIDGTVWRAALPTRAGEWIERCVPFRDLERTFRGRKLIGVEDLDPATIGSFSFSIADKDPTPFELEIDWMRVYRDA